MEELYQLLIVLADCIGYYSNKDIKVNENFLNDNWSWTGCGAGKHVIGILHNGDIVACTSIRDKTLVAEIFVKIFKVDLGKSGLFLSGIEILIVVS